MSRLNHLWLVSALFCGAIGGMSAYANGIALFSSHPGALSACLGFAMGVVPMLAAWLFSIVIDHDAPRS